MWRGSGTSGDSRNRGTEMRGGGVRAGLRTFPDGSDELFAGGEGGGLGPVVDTELGDQVGDVGLDRAGADEKGLGDLAVSAALDKETQDVELASRQAEWLSGTDCWRGIVHRTDPGEV